MSCSISFCLKTNAAMNTVQYKINAKRYLSNNCRTLAISIPYHLFRHFKQWWFAEYRLSRVKQFEGKLECCFSLFYPLLCKLTEQERWQVDVLCWIHMSELHCLFHFADFYSSLSSFLKSAKLNIDTQWKSRCRAKTEHVSSVSWEHVHNTTWLKHQEFLFLPHIVG